MTTLDLQVSASTDDAYERGNGTFDDTATTIRVTSNSNSSNQFHGACRWDNVTVPAGATIDTAYIEMYVDTTGADDPNFTLYGNDEDDPGAITDILGLTQTTASASYVTTGTGAGWYGSGVEIKTIIQDIIDRAGWASGNAIVLIMWANSDTTENFIFQSYDGTPSNAAKLHIEYTAAATGSMVPKRRTKVYTRM